MELVMFLLLKEYPYDVSGTTLKVLQNIQETDPLRPSKTNKHFNSDIEAILLKSLEKNLGRRYASAVELKRAHTEPGMGRQVRRPKEMREKYASRHYYRISIGLRPVWAGHSYAIPT